MANSELGKLSLEDTFTKIDEVMEALTDDKVSLEESFELYKSGMEMLKHAGDVIDTVEKRVIELSKTDSDMDIMEGSEE